MRNGEIIGYNVGYKIYGSSEPYSFKTVEVNSSHYNSITLSGLLEYTKYYIVIRAFNRIGPGPSSEEIVVTTLEDGIIVVHLSAVLRSLSLLCLLI